MLNRIVKLLFHSIFILVIIYGYWAIGHLFYFAQNTDLRLQGEGLWPPALNFRDIGVSINDCMQEEHLVEGKFFRSGRYFSGFPCSIVSSPKHIIGLENRRDRRDRFYCRRGLNLEQNEVIYDENELHDIEIIENWQKPGQKEIVCRYLSKIFQGSVGGASDGNILIHCFAGRDRTGAISSILASIALGENVTREEKYRAIECDYQKTESLAPVKRGRMQRFHESIDSEYGGIENFLVDMCGFDSKTIQAFRQKISGKNYH